uniref:NADH dehydrogenase subunit 2 n=1 Tax=Trichuris discolor TaxID=483153 RepID=J3SGP2_9BILA|nr:NADH dehydrogenase subunit 2 [Trichuris discolor]AFK81035.1 NADH dehydrogenase subunit 2 [Trichuris discolor]
MLLLMLLPWYLSYVVLIIMSSSMNNWLSMWTMLEISSWLMLMLSLPENFTYEMVFKMYFMFSMSSIALVLFWLNFSHQEEWLLCVLAFKMGLPPLHWWIAWVMKHMQWNIMWWFTTFHKLIPMLISLLIISSSLIIWWALVSILWGSLMFWASVSYYVIFLYSSCIHTGWMWLSMFDSYAFFLYFITYTTTMLFIFMKIKLTEFWHYDLDLLTSLTILLGIPMSMIFFVKMISTGIYFHHSTLMMWVMVLINTITILPYTRMIWNLSQNMPNTNFKYNINVKSSTYMLMILQYSIWPMLL